MALLRDSADAPHLGRSVLMAPGRRVNLAAAGHPLATVTPRTQLGRVALDLALQTSTATIQIVATSTYVNALTALAAPVITFTTPPPGTQGLTVQELQTAYQTFEQQLATLQGQAQQWIATSGGGGGASIFSNLVSIAGTIAGLNQTVQAQFTILQTLPPGSQTWKDALAKAITLVGVEAAPATSLQGQITTLATNLDNAATGLVTATSTGVLAQLQTAYQDEIAALNADIDSCNTTISDDNKKIIGLGFAAGAAIVVGIVGLLNWWNPIGWIMLAGGAVGAYFAIAEIESLKGEIALKKQEIQNDTNIIDTDQTAAQTVAMFAKSAQAAADMNSAAQQELTTLAQLCGTLAAEMNIAVQDLNNDDIADALTEWNEVIAAAGFLGGITAYIWPSTIQLSNATMLSANGDQLYLVSNSGTVFQYTSGGNTWTALPGSSLSGIAVSGGLAAIDGAPNDASQLQPNSYGQSFIVKGYGGGTWTNLSTFPAAQVADDGTGIFAINQTVSDRQAYRYTGNGTTWLPVGAMPNNDAPGSIATYSGTLFAIANNGDGLWYAGSGGGWTQVGTATYTRMSANGGWLGLVDTSGNGWVIDVQTAGSYQPAAMMTSISLLAQAPNGDQYVTDTSLNLWHVGYVAGGSPTSTQLKQNIVGMTVSDGGTVYATDNAGDIWMLTNLSSNSWQQLPALPTS